MKKDIKQELIDNVYNDELFKGVQGDLSEDEQKKINVAIESFIQTLALPLVEQFQKVMESSESQEELKKQIRKANPELFKK